MHTIHCIEFNDVSFQYLQTTILEHLSFQIPRGAYVGIIGPNGGGKTTLLKLILGLLKPNAGTISIFGHDIKTAKKHFEMGYVPQKMADIEKKFPATVWEIVASGRTARRGVFHWQTRQDKKIIEQSMALTNVTHLQKRLIGTLSGGERQRVFIARALAREPKILILDEPTRGIDIGAKYEIYCLMNALTEQGKSIIMISSELPEVLSMSDRLLVMHKGRIKGELVGEQMTADNVMKLVIE